MSPTAESVAAAADEATAFAVTGARVVTPDAVVDGGVRVEGDRIVDVGEVDTDGAVAVAADGRFLLPGLVDLHGDDIESHLHPRSGARMDTHMALAAADRSNLAAGITTKFHAISFETDPDSDRSPELGAELTAAVESTDDLMADHRIHARCEVTQAECVEAVLDVVDAGHADLVSVMSHIPGKGQFRDQEAFMEYYRDSGDHTVEEAEEMIAERGDVEMATLRDRVERVVERAHDAGAVTASHDDEDPAEVERLAETGVDVTEYPITMETAERAADLGMTVAMGAPNLVRGESQWGNLETAAAIDAGVVDALVADYHPPSMLAGAFVDTGEPLPERVARVTADPAAAVGLSDRGRIETGARADLVLVDRDPSPTVRRAFVAGDPVYRAEGSR
ncbi:alpha-D-ribose 1-methylphosphonate 5-triphosphate diphosphatase [Halosimplex pelagicum]|uniref:Alpha-D-ribose 1-methylphosphonate 5-triphosphate diphosphatase n=1 Tax=Halosimplex pelagicum TaxID=869886 RepID=A0A7D5THR2_9EURY|nr:alpha-D-ribose 1-methylphosphonate 5-triphosphate diphosphatase [Halosimplex pelagicum]QLH83116.1 alpha-D-ribose 1-methylphosphonate 5-triphosphate diphosphatase [Halosimplex pelagicum]